MQIQDTYLLGFDELNVILSALVADDYSGEEVEQTIEDFLISSYARGFEATEDTIDEMFEMDVTRMFEVVDQETAGEDFRTRIRDHLAQKDYEGVKRVAETEFHRVYNEGILDAANKSSKSLMKIWRTMEDDKVRDTHFYLEGVKIPLDEEFVTYDGDSALYPSGFSLASNNVNCRCVIDITLA